MSEVGLSTQVKELKKKLHQREEANNKLVAENADMREGIRNLCGSEMGLVPTEHTCTGGSEPCINEECPLNPKHVAWKQRCEENRRRWVAEGSPERK